MVCPCAWNWLISREYWSNDFRAPDLSSAARVAAGRCFTSVPGVLLKNISSNACRAVCGPVCGAAAEAFCCADAAACTAELPAHNIATAKHSVNFLIDIL